MRHAIKKTDVIWGYLSQILNISSSLILLPFILIYLNSEDIGVWYVFITMIGLIQLLEFGFLPTTSRYISYIYSGAKDIIGSDVITSDEDKVDVQFLSNIISSSRTIYLIVSCISVVIIVFGGTLYLSTLDYKGDFHEIYLAWVIYGLATILLFYFGYYNSILKGRGDQTALNKITVVSKLTNILFTIPLLSMGFGIKSIAFGVLASAIIDRILVGRAVHYSKDSKEVTEAFNLKSNKSYTRVIWKQAKLMGIVQLGNFLTTRASLLVVSTFIGLDAAAKYGFTLQITSVAVIVSSMYFGLQMPRLSSEYIKGKFDIIKFLFIRSLGISWLLFLIYFGMIMVCGSHILSLISENTTILPSAMLFVYLISAFLEMNHSLCTAYLTTKNEIIFTKAIICTGVLIVIFACILGYFFGLWGVILSQFICQALYNNWKWPFLVFKQLNIKVMDPLIALKW